ncbi:LuxR C-terminal-related transcriptional regulator [Streptomyces sp. NPDC001020]
MRILIAEDNVLLRDGLELLLTGEGHDVCATVDNADDLPGALLGHRPDVAVVDVRLPPDFRDGGLRAVVEVRKSLPDLPVLVLSQYVERAYASELLAQSASGVGYLLKDRVGRTDEFLEALQRVAEGGTVMDPEVISQLMIPAVGDDPLASLTRREREVLALMAQGHNNSTIAETLFIVESSVNKHIGNIFAKLGMPTPESGHRRVLAVLAYLRA